jgi:hypothetical protein
MIYVIKEDERPGPDAAGAKARNIHIQNTAKKSSETFPGVFGSLVSSDQDLRNCLARRGPDAATLHIFAHGNQVQIGKFSDDDNDSFIATDSLARILRDKLRAFERLGIARLILHSCYGGSHIAKLGVTIKYFVLPKGRQLTLEGANGAAFTDKAGNLRVARDDQAAHALDQAVADKVNADRFDVLLKQHCQEVAQGMERIELSGEYVPR